MATQFNFYGFLPNTDSKSRKVIKQFHGSKFIEEALDLGASVAIHDDPNFKINNKN